MKDWTFQLLAIQKDKKDGTGIGIGIIEITETAFTSKTGGLFVLAKVDEGISFDLFYYNLWGKK